MASPSPSSKYISLTDLVEPSQYKNKDGSTDYEKLHDLFPLPDQTNGRKQSIRLPNTFQPGKFSSVYRSSISPDNLVHRVAPDLKTLHDHFEKTVELHPDYDCAGTRHCLNKETREFENDYTFETYKQIQTRRNNLGSGIKTLVGRPNGESYIVSLFSSNRAEWLISSLAVQAYGLTSTALYDTLGPKASQYILNFTESPILIASYDKLLKILQTKRLENGNGLPHLKFLVSMDELNFEKDAGLIALAADAGIKLLSFKQLEKLGESNPLPHEPRNETFCISFTSGTTGNPKGVIITQEMAVSGLAFATAHIEKPAKHLKSNEKQVRYYSFLPLAHIYELMNIYIATSAGYKIYFPFDPSPLSLLDHLKMIKPHFTCLVPRVFTKMESGLKQGLNQSVVGRNIISKVIKNKHDRLAKGDHSETYMSQMVAPIIRKKIGFDSVIFCNSGSAPISKETVEFLRASLNIGFKQGYGLTESFSGCSISFSGETEITSGPIAVSTEMKLRDVPEMNYVTTDSDGNELEEPQGELLLRGAQIFPGYYKNPEATAESFTEDGWFKTGDIAKIDTIGRINIVDRVKNFFKLAQGEYVTPERIENIYLSACSSLLQQCFVHGDSVQTYLVGIIGVEIENLRKIIRPVIGSARLHSLKDEELLKLVNDNKKYKRHLLDLMNKEIKNEGLQGFEKLHNFKVKIDPLKVEDENMTPTLKIKRPNATRFFRKELTELYAEGSLIRGNANL